MAVKPNARDLKIAEQIIEDEPSGLTFQFTVIEGSTAPYRLRMFDRDSGRSREIIFDANGHEAGSGTDLTGSCRPTWIREAP